MGPVDIPDNHEWVHVALPYLSLEPLHVEQRFWQAYCSCNGSQLMGSAMAEVMAGRMAVRVMKMHGTE